VGEYPHLSSARGVRLLPYFSNLLAFGSFHFWMAKPAKTQFQLSTLYGLVRRKNLPKRHPSTLTLSAG
jgi:hypothetical protein